jgi:hypothetical protein
MKGEMVLKGLNIREALNTQQSLILVNGMEHKVDLPLSLSQLANSQTTSTKREHKTPKKNVHNPK